MKTLMAGFALVVFLTACDNGSASTEQKLDSLGDKFEKAAERTWDSTKEKGKDLYEKAKEKLDGDSADRKDTINQKQ